MIVHRLDSGQALATVGPILIRVIADAPTDTADFDQISAIADELLTRWSLIGMWVVVHHGAPIPSGPVRRYGGRMLKPYGERVTIAYALLGLGFWASMAAGASMALSKLAGVPSSLATTLERSAAQLCMDLIGIDPGRLLAAHDELFARMQAAKAA